MKNIYRSRIFVIQFVTTLSIVVAVFLTFLFLLDLHFIAYTPQGDPRNKSHHYGDWGRGVELKNLPVDVQLLVDEGWKKHAFNEFVSNLISIRRNLPDERDKWCTRRGRYLKNLPRTSVVICFHNEARSTLLRTVHSVLDRTPDHLLEEIILVDDFSNMKHLKDELEHYFLNYSKVKIVRTERRLGIVKSRLIGTKLAEAPVVTYLDAHCECTKGWLPPLLDRIARNPTTVVSPVIDVIDEATFEYIRSNKLERGVFDWNFNFQWEAVPKKEKDKHQYVAEPFQTPTIAGGLFSIDKKFFEQLGTYDGAFEIWGVENLELSFRTWMCGGTLEIVPCSHVGHVFRSWSPYEWIPGVDVIRRNAVRLAEVWLDEYAENYYRRINYKKGYYGDLSSRKELRKKLGCKNFKWYLDNIFPELFVPSEGLAFGEFKNLGANMCLDQVGMGYNSPVNTYPCHGQKGNQVWALSKIGEIRQDNSCLDYNGKEIVHNKCIGLKGFSQHWKYNELTMIIQHDKTLMCLAIDNKKLILTPCNSSIAHQRWTLEDFDVNK